MDAEARDRMHKATASDLHSEERLSKALEDRFWNAVDRWITQGSRLTVELSQSRDPFDASILPYAEQLTDAVATGHDGESVTFNGAFKDGVRGDISVDFSGTQKRPGSIEKIELDEIVCIFRIAGDFRRGTITEHRPDKRPVS